MVKKTPESDFKIEERIDYAYPPGTILGVGDYVEIYWAKPRPRPESIGFFFSDIHPRGVSSDD